MIIQQSTANIRNDKTSEMFWYLPRLCLSCPQMSPPVLSSLIVSILLSLRIHAPLCSRVFPILSSAVVVVVVSMSGAHPDFGQYH